MAKLIIVYGHPQDPDEFERYYTTHHLPFAADRMPHVTGAENMKVVGTTNGPDAPWYRVSQLSYDSMADLRAGIASEDGRAVLADLDNFATGGATVVVADN